MTDIPSSSLQPRFPSPFTIPCVLSTPLFSLPLQAKCKKRDNMIEMYTYFS